MSKYVANKITSVQLYFFNRVYQANNREELQSKLNGYHELLILAYRKDEYENGGIPADIIEVTDQKKNTDLYLEKGRYTIVLKDRNDVVIETFDIEV